MQKPFRKVYIEITNVCNLNCSFCPGTRREPCFMRPEVFARALGQVRPYTDYIYLHLMGEPLLHPQLIQFLDMAERVGLRVNLTTNGTWIAKAGDSLLLAPALRKVGFSLHSYEANRYDRRLEDYLADIFAFVDRAKERGVICELRLWNQDASDRTGANALNETVVRMVKDRFGTETERCRRGSESLCLQEGVYLEFAPVFDWPDGEAAPGGREVFCLGLRDHIGILADGTVVPCCMDAEGSLALGNILDEPLAEILQKPRARGIYEGFSARTAIEPLCRRCGYARRF
ncbi:radical SAM/SPASM domain-containing protein [Anaerotruncus rubiinfantis]|uniref:radical SAM/SPASM domain-containing protein n=1 Tax=Anaerotruncus rubiinfantis TaxID=1720200 RepID=UPI000835E545|nr:radical SAM protein [Anaerotruncus rubiinfantis]